MKKAREFWIFDNFGPKISINLKDHRSMAHRVPPVNKIEEFIHVVEYSALELAEKRIEKLRKALREISNMKNPGIIDGKITISQKTALENLAEDDKLAEGEE